MLISIALHSTSLSCLSKPLIMSWQSSSRALWYSVQDAMMEQRFTSTGVKSSYHTHMYLRGINKSPVSELYVITSLCRLQQGSIWSRWGHPKHSKGLWPDNNRHILNHRGHTDAVWPGPHPLLIPHTTVAVNQKTWSIDIKSKFNCNQTLQILSVITSPSWATLQK